MRKFHWPSWITDPPPGKDYCGKCMGLYPDPGPDIAGLCPACCDDQDARQMGKVKAAFAVLSKEKQTKVLMEMIELYKKDVHG